MDIFEISNLLKNKEFTYKGLKFTLHPSTSPVDGFIKQVQVNPSELREAEVVGSYTLIQDEKGEVHISITQDKEIVLPTILSIGFGFIPDGQNPENYLLLG